MRAYPHNSWFWQCFLFGWFNLSLVLNVAMAGELDNMARLIQTATNTVTSEIDRENALCGIRDLASC